LPRRPTNPAHVASPGDPPQLRPASGAPIPPSRSPFPTALVLGGAAAFLAVAALFRIAPLDLKTAAVFYGWPGGAWPGLRWGWAEALYRWGQAPADVVGGLGCLAFGLSFASKRLRPLRGPGLYLGLLLLLGPGLGSNVLAKGLAGRPRPEQTVGFGGAWEYHGPFDFGVPGRGASFISGHASNAWFFLGLFFLAGPSRPKKFLALAGALAFGAAMSFARVSQGAHWLSDTLLAGLLLWTLAAALSPLIDWQPRRLFTRPETAWALAAGIAAWLLISHPVYEERDFSAPIPGGGSALHRDLPAPPAFPCPEVDLDLTLLCGQLDVRFDAPDLSPLAFTDAFQGLALPFARERLDSSPLAPGGGFTPPEGAWGISLRQSLSGIWFAREGRQTLDLPSATGIDARLRVREGAITLDALPEGRRVLLSGLPAGWTPLPGFRPYGSRDWVRDGKAPLLSLKLDAPELRFHRP